jgi:hypothetical protein
MHPYARGFLASGDFLDQTATFWKKTTIFTKSRDSLKIKKIAIFSRVKVILGKKSRKIDDFFNTGGY